MKTVSITQYLEAVGNSSGRFKTLSGLELLRDSQGLPRYAVRSGSLDIAVSVQGQSHVICCPLQGAQALELHRSIRDRYAGRPPRVLLAEVLIFPDRQESFWQDVLLVESPPDLFVPADAARTDQPERSARMTFTEGLAVTERAGLYGYVDPQGNTVIPFRYEWADPFDEGLAVVRKNGNFGLIDKRGREICPPEYEDIRWLSDNGVVLACREGAWSLKNREGEPIHTHTFDYICDFAEDLAVVRREDRYGYIDRCGEIVIPLIYDQASSFSAEGLATVEKKGHCFCIDTQGMVFD